MFVVSPFCSATRLHANIHTASSKVHLHREVLFIGSTTTDQMLKQQPALLRTGFTRTAVSQ